MGAAYGAKLKMARGLWRGGDANAGFEVRIDRAKRILRFDFWGFWDEALGKLYRDSCLTAMRELHASGEAWHVLANLSRYPAQKPEVQKCHADTMVAGPQLGMKRAANLVANTLSQMQIRRLSQESGIPEFSFFKVEAEAIEWLETGVMKHQ